MNDFLDSPRRARGTDGPFDAAAAGPLAIGIDIGGTNIRAEVIRDPSESAELVAEIRQDVGAARAPADIAKRLGDIVRELSDQAGGERLVVGVGFAGMLEGRGGFVKHSPHLRWHDVPFGQMLRDELGHDHVGVWNDVNAITYGEYRRGAGRGATDVLAVFVGTGVGAGMISAGQLVEGATGCAAEIGHCKVVLDDSARPCACGHRGCVEAYIGGHYLKRRARCELAGGARSLAVSIAGGADKVHPGHLEAAAERGDDYALDLYAEIAPMLGAALANAVTLLNPSHLIVGGGMLSRMPILIDHIVASLEVAVNPPAGESLIVTSAELGDRAGTIGAALLALERYA